MTRLQVGIALVVVVLLSLLVVVLLRQEDTSWLYSAFECSVQKLQLVQAISRDLLAAVEAEKSAGMAETDETSQAFAEQSMQAAQRVGQARHALEPLLESKPEEARLFREFSQCWDRLQELVREVLALAVQNTRRRSGYPLALPLSR